MKGKNPKKGSELVDLRNTQGPRAGFVFCYGSGSPFRKEKGGLHRVETSRKRLVSRALCVVNYYGKRCGHCPNSEANISFAARGADGP